MASGDVILAPDLPTAHFQALRPPPKAIKRVRSFDVSVAPGVGANLWSTMTLRTSRAFQKEWLLLGLRASYNATMSAAGNACGFAVIRGNTNASIVQGGLADVYLSSAVWAAGAGVVTNLPIHRNTGVSFDPPFVPLLGPNESLGFYCSDRAAAGDAFSVIFYVYYLFLTDL